ncbi:hypothetical protein [Streptomyces sp. LNU-CPARS28]|uniref:hypothetical protein n=1 Tax=Streptomyces sp. LNU-CPARS28 TaxID=3137371 RepID=UPI003137516B
MPRGRHRHSPPLHRLLPPSAVAGFSLVCAGGAWMFAEPVVLRGLAAAAAASAVIGSVVMRQWDRSAGKRVAELSRARASDEWRYDERIAEAESDLEESRELRTKLEAKLRSKRAELAALRNEHAALLRRYATAETERASALEGRRLLAIETSTPTRALPPGVGADEGEVGASAEVEAAAGEAESVDSGSSSSSSSASSSSEESVESVGSVGSVGSVDSGSAGESVDGVGSAQGSEPSEGVRVAVRPGASPTPSLYGRANDALDRLARAEARPAVTEGGLDAADGSDVADAAEFAEDGDAAGDVDGGDGQGKPAAVDGHGHERAAAGHFAVPTAAAVVPPARVRRPAGEGGFDFFGTKSTSAKSVAPAALEAVQNEDLADVVGEEALAVHKAEAEAEFRPSDAATDAERGVGQVIDLTAHDETEQIDVEGLRTALRA